MTYTVRITDLRKSYGSTEVLKGVDLAIAPGTVHGLLGANGAGKTTLVRILATLSGYDSGSAEVAGHDVATEAPAVRRKISLTGQYAAVDEMLTGFENLTMVARLRRLSRTHSRARVAELVEEFDLGTIVGRRSGTYSGGQRRRLDLAMSMVVPPTLLFLDEPTTGLDPRSREQVWGTVRRLAESGVTVLLTTQYLEEADQLADQISVLDGGRIVADGTAEELKGRIATEVVRLTYADLAPYESALERLSGRDVSPDPALLTLDVPTDGSPEMLTDLLGALAGSGAAPRRVSTHAPSLDDVFLSLTDPGARRTAAPEAQEALR